MGEAFQVVIEVGHKASTLKEPIGNFIYKWNLFLRSGDERQQIDKVVQKVVFNLHETFKNPVRECTQPPYCVKENGYGEFEFPIDIYFNGTNEKYTISYLLDLPPIDSFTPLNRFRKEIITFVDPNPEFRSLLVESGALPKKIPTTTSNSTSSLKKKTNSSSILNSSLNTSTNLNISNASLNSPNSSLVVVNSSKLNQSINGSTFLASNSAIPSEKKKSTNKKSLIRNDLSNQNSKVTTIVQSVAVDADLKSISNTNTNPITPPPPPPKKSPTSNAQQRLTPNNEITNENKVQLTKINNSKSLVKTKSKLNTITNNDELEKIKNESDVSNLSTNSKKRPFVQSNESISIKNDLKLDENKKKPIADADLKLKKIKSNNKLASNLPLPDTKPKNTENELDDESKNKKNKKFKNDLDNLFSPLQSTLMTPPPSLNTNGTNSCTSSVSSSCNYNTSPSSLSSLCLNKEQNKLKTKPENEEKTDDYEKYDKEESKKSRRRKYSSGSGDDEAEYRKDKDRDRDKHRRSSNSHHSYRRNYKRRNSNDYENDSDADSYYHYKNNSYRHHSRDRDSKSKSSRNGNGNSGKTRLDDDETSSTVSTLSSSSSNDKNYKKYSDSKNTNSKQPTNHNRDMKSIKNLNDQNYRERMLNLYDKILHVYSSKQIDLLAKICGLVKPFSFTENQSFNFDLFTLDLNVIEKLENLVFESSSLSQNGTSSSSSLDTSKKLKSKEMSKT